MTNDTRRLGQAEAIPHGRFLLAGEPLVFHCNFYNYWLQKTLLLDPGLGMEAVIQDAATTAVFPLLVGSEDAATLRQRAADTFAELGFGLIDLSQLTSDGGLVEFPISHYGRCLRQASGKDFSRPQSYFDAGYAAAAAAAVFGEPLGTFQAEVVACQSQGAARGQVRVARRDGAPLFGWAKPARLGEGTPPAPFAETHVDEGAILEALAGLDFSGNEEGLIPRFGVMLTRHMANFYNRISFEFVRRMQQLGLEEAAQALLIDAGYRCAFHTFGGIMVSAEWNAVVRPQCQTRDDWVHGMVAVVNALGWGTWRVTSLEPDRIVVRIYDDYESAGWLDLYGPSESPVAYLASAGIAGMMNLVHVGNIHETPELDLAFYKTCFEASGLFESRQLKSIAMGDPYTEIEATR